MSRQGFCTYAEVTLTIHLNSSDCILTLFNISFSHQKFVEGHVYGKKIKTYGMRHVSIGVFP